MILPLVPLFFLQGCCCPNGDGGVDPPPPDEPIEICCEFGVVIQLSRDLIATFEDISTCGCTFDQVDVPLTYDEASDPLEPTWRSDSDPITQCPGVEIAPVRFSNDVGGCVSIFHDIRDGAAGEWPELTKSCDPFEYIFTSPDGCMRVTVTEAP
jgi:hypothetical protein